MRKLLLLVFSAVLSLTIADRSFGFAQSDQDCTKCHSLSVAEAQAALRAFNPGIVVTEVRPGPLKGLWEVDFELGGKKLVYIDYSKKFFFSGDMLSFKERRNVTQDRLTDLNRVDVSEIPFKDALVMGDKNAKHRIIVFDDPD